MNSDRRPGTRLPDDPAYWEELAVRSVDVAFGVSAGQAGLRVAHGQGAAPDPWWRGISDAAFMLAASAVVALFGGSLLLGERSPRAMPDARPIPQARALTAPLAPDDPLLASLLDASAGPPSASALLELVALREEER
ncbi:MAG: hypothetical protein ACRELV_05365 [Longimicrobiales bacterium]